MATPLANLSNQEEKLSSPKRGNLPRLHNLYISFRDTLCKHVTFYSNKMDVIALLVQILQAQSC